MPHTLTNRGLHESVRECVLSKHERRELRAADSRARLGAMAARLSVVRRDVVAVDRDSQGFEVSVPHVCVEFDQRILPLILARARLRWLLPAKSSSTPIALSASFATFGVLNALTPSERIHARKAGAGEG